MAILINRALSGMFVCLLFLIACKGRNETASLFTEVPASHSHINFQNNISENEDYNIDTYEYLYNGGGVAIGDLNNDGLMDIVFTANMSADKIYLNRGNLQFEDITEQTGFNSRNKWKTGVVIADINGDQLPDIYLCYSGPGTDEERTNELYLNTGVSNGTPHFKESAKELGLDAPGTFTTMASFFDMDNDGDLDMFMVNHADMFYNPFFNSDKLRNTRHPRFGNRLYKNENGHFTDISEQAGIHGSGLNFGLSVSISDINSDGWPDIYVTNDYDERDFLYLNNKNGKFREVLDTAARHISEFSMGSDIADYNNDGKPDLVVLDMLPEDNYRQKTLKGPDNYNKYMLRVSKGFHQQQMRNTLQLNNGNDQSGNPIFSEVGQLAGISNTDWSWAPLLADFDNDGWKDLFVSNGVLRDMTNLDFVKYALTYSSKSKRPTQDKRKMWEQIREMKTPELHNYIFRNNQDLGFSNVTKDWGISKDAVSNGAAYADLDNDGDLDLVINALNGPSIIYENHASNNMQVHWVKIRLVGEGANTMGIGAKIFTSTATTKQMQEQYLTRGFQSAVDPILHVGLGKDSIIEQITVRWPGGKQSQLQQLKADTQVTIRQSDATMPIRDSFGVNRPLFRNITSTTGINFTHQPPAFIDFNSFPLLPFQLSKIGPCLAKADVNGDRREDIFIGASSGQESILYLQTGNGTFSRSPSQPWNDHIEITNADALFFDADADGDPDLYLVSGGATYNAASKNYQDRFFENDGKGNFKELSDALPRETISGACARTADIDRDGLPDLFIGGMYVPGRFPEAPESFVLRNRSNAGKIRFENDSTSQDPILNHMGMVTDAAWIDMDKDGWQDLVVVGQFMPIHLFKNNKGKLQDASAGYGLAGTNGWWRRILADDLDGDGDTDLIVGNMGLNTPFKASSEQPVSIIYGDFYAKGVISPILCYYNNGKNYPWNSRDEIADQIPSIQKKFIRYEDFANAQLTDLFTADQLSRADTIKVNMLASVYLKNNGNQAFTITSLPSYAQVSAVNGIEYTDMDGDGKKDLVLCGNFYPFRVQIGPLDGSIGLVLKGDGKGGFVPLYYAQTGLLINGDVRNMMTLKIADRLVMVIAKNNGSVQVIEYNGNHIGT